MVVFGVAAVLAAALEYGNRMGKGGAVATNPEFQRFRSNYLIVYSLMMGASGDISRASVGGSGGGSRWCTPMQCRGGGPCPPRHQVMPTPRPPPAPAAGDWLQGPYVYALYQHYGFERGDIGRLFIAGFGSSMIFGTVVGALADKQ